jgi:NAD(P)-dependent dehydrogenase (short-subunit alcohol dehydrogenase family)
MQAAWPTAQMMRLAWRTSIGYSAVTYPLVNSFSDQVVVVTGAASGIGKALATCFLREGSRVVLADVDGVTLDQTANELASYGRLLAVHCDVSLEQDIENLRDKVYAEYGAVDILCNNAGVGVAGFSWETPANVWDWTLAVNVKGVMHAVRAFVPDMVSRNNGYIVNVASVAAFLAPIGMSAYVASKHAVIGLSETMHHELAVRANEVGISVVCPGMVDTNISESHRYWPTYMGDAPDMFEDRSAQVIRKRHKRALARSKDPLDVADAILDGIRERQFWIFTDDTYHVDIRERVAGAVEGEAPVAPKYV